MKKLGLLIGCVFLTGLVFAVPGVIRETVKVIPVSEDVTKIDDNKYMIKTVVRIKTTTVIKKSLLLEAKAQKQLKVDEISALEDKIALAVDAAPADVEDILPTPVVD